MMFFKFAAVTALLVATLSPFVLIDSLNVHINCHTHDDVGWLKTVDQYYYGGNNSIQHAGVQYILDTVVPALLANPSRKFMYVEQAFFQRWYRQQTDDLQNSVKQLVANGQLEFINGGWCMHDEAAPHFVDMIDQTTLGHKFIRQEFGVTPRIGWQIDPFGHSSTQASLMSAEVGFDALFFGRMDYQDHDLRMKEKRMEFVWDSSSSLGSANAIFTGAFQDGNYNPPSSFCYDQNCDDPPIQDDKRLEDYNVQERVDEFVKAALDYSSHITGNNIIFNMGSDFQYENAHVYFKNLDKLIEYVNKDGRVNAFYSTPSQYVDAKHAENIQITTKADDFFPYADGQATFWTGYFTSRPALKRYIRASSHLLQVFRQIEVLAGGSDGSLTDQLAQAQGVAQHHDAVAGTSKQHVAFDYAKRLAGGVNVALPNIQTALSTFTQSSPSSSAPQFSNCFLTNVTICATTQTSSSFIINSYNALHRERSELISVPVAKNTALKVSDKNGVIPSQIVEAISNNAKTADSAKYVLNFVGKVPALGYNTFTVEPATADDVDNTQRETLNDVNLPSSYLPSADQDITIANQYTSVTVSASTGLLSSIKDLVSGNELPITQDFGWYAPIQKDDTNPSGAYIFRTNGTHTPYPVNTAPVAAKLVSNGPVVWEIHQVVSSWYTQIIRLSASSPHVEFEYTVGDIPIDDGVGKEIITRFSSNIKSAGKVYTDSNGREFIERQLNFRPTWNLTQTEPVAGNYYPVNAAIYVKDTVSALTILNDRSQGGASLSDGEIEIMVHRRLLKDDWRGVGEPLNETESCTPYPNFSRVGKGLVITGIHYLLFTPVASQMKAVRPFQQRVYLPVYNSYAPLTGPSAAWFSSHASTHSFAMNALPVNVELITLQQWTAKVVLLRLGHSFAINEDSQLSAPATVDIATLFSGFKVASITELSLTANQPLTSINRLKWQTQTTPNYVNRGNLTGTVATLTAMEIRTFAVALA